MMKIIIFFLNHVLKINNYLFLSRWKLTLGYSNKVLQVHKQKKKKKKRKKKDHYLQFY